MVVKKNILVYPAGSEGAINIYNALKYNIHFNVYGATMVNNHSRFIYDDEHYFEEKLSITSPEFFDNFNKILDKLNIDFILCTHDEVITFMMRNQDKIHATVCCSPLETTEIAFDKKATYDFFANCEFCPQIYKNIDEVKFKANSWCWW